MRNLKKLAANVFDVLVVGGGAHGAAVAYHAAKSGFKTAIVEKEDFCSATSGNSLKIIHGGLRYLQHANIKRMRHSIVSRREMMQLAPHFVKPLSCMMPTQGFGLRSKRLMQMALLLNDAIAWDRNHGVEKSIHIPKGHVVSKEKCLETIPSLSTDKLSGAAVWYDALAIDTERLILEYILESVRYGATAANYVEMVSLDMEDDQCYTITLSDRLSQEKYLAKAKIVVNAAGPWFEHTVFGKTAGVQKQKWALAVNLVSRKQIFREHAVALEGMADYRDKDALLKRGKRLYFFVPWRGYTMIGTEYEVCRERPENFSVSATTIQNMIDGVNSIYPKAALQFTDISFYHAGLMPVQEDSEGNNVQLEKNSSFRCHESRDFPNVISIRGVKFTTAPYIAGELIRLIKKKIHPKGKKPTRSRYEKTNNELSSMQDPVAFLLQERYGHRAIRVLAYVKAEDNGDVWLDEESAFLKGEVKYLIYEELACKVSDVVLRRTGLGSAEFPGHPFLEKLTAYMGDLLCWSDTRRKQEIDEVVRRYKPLHYH